MKFVIRTEGKGCNYKSLNYIYKSTGCEYVLVVKGIHTIPSIYASGVIITINQQREVKAKFKAKKLSLPVFE